MILIGHDSGRYGYLCNQDGAPIPPESIAQRCGCSLEQYTALLAELTRAGVPSTSSHGVLFSRRMVRDDEKRAMGAERQRRFKKRKKEGNASVTQKKRDGNAFYEDENENETVVVSILKSKKKATYEDLKAFCSELNLPVGDSEYLFNHWEGNGWTNGHKPIRNWKATIRAWKAARLLPSQKNGTQNRITFDQQKTFNTLAAAESFGNRHEDG